MGKKITVKDMKHDGLVEAVATTAGFMQRYRGIFLTIGVVLVIIVVVIVAISYHSSSMITQAATELSQARSKEALRGIYEQYPESPSAPLALVQFASILYDDAEFEPAGEAYKLFLKRYPGHPLSSFAQMGKAYCLESRGRLEEAVGEYARVGELYPASSLIPEAGINKGRCQARQGRAVEAIESYREVIERFPRSLYAGLAREELVNLQFLGVQN